MSECATNSSPLAGEEGARRAAVGRRGGALARARSWRRNSTAAEDALWRLLRNKRLAGWKFKRQQPLGPYTADFVCFAARLIVEADGSQHIGSAHDADRDAWLGRQNFRILRLYNNDILARSEEALAAILAALESDDAGIEPASSLTPLPSPPPQGGREK